MLGEHKKAIILTDVRTYNWIYGLLIEKGFKPEKIFKMVLQEEYDEWKQLGRKE